MKFQLILMVCVFVCLFRTFHSTLCLVIYSSYLFVSLSFSLSATSFMFKFLFAELSISGTTRCILNFMEHLLNVARDMHCHFFFSLTIDPYFLTRTCGVFCFCWLVGLFSSTPLQRSAVSCQSWVIFRSFLVTKESLSGWL